MRIFCVIALVFLLSACSSGPERVVHTLTPVPDGPQDPGDEVLKAEVQDFLKTAGAPVASQFEFTRFDLDNDGRRDALVLFRSPYGYWCDLHGCTMLVMKAKDTSFSLVNAIQPVRAPLYISETENNGWKSLLVRVSGRWDKAKDVAMMFNGQQYPDNPEDLPASPRNEIGEYVRVFEKG